MPIGTLIVMILRVPGLLFAWLRIVGILATLNWGQFIGCIAVQISVFSLASEIVGGRDMLPRQYRWFGIGHF